METEIFAKIVKDGFHMEIVIIEVGVNAEIDVLSGNIMKKRTKPTLKRIEKPMPKLEA